MNTGVLAVTAIRLPPESDDWRCAVDRFVYPRNLGLIAGNSGTEAKRSDVITGYLASRVK